jgi:hypothetical protein
MLTGKSFVADNMWREILLPVSQRDVGEDLGGAADDGRVVIDGGVTGDQKMGSEKMGSVCKN